MYGQIIILHGPSSSGKSTTAKAIQGLVELPFWHISIDHLRDSGVLPTDRIDRQEFLWSDLRKPFFAGFHASLAACAKAGNNLIVEHILDTPDWVPELKNLLAPFDVLFVGLHCELEELKAREFARGDRPFGSAKQDYHTIHAGRVYDIEVNGQANVEENAQAILEFWRSGLRQSEFTVSEKGSA
ncbi:chloramphenicol phosphotransferase CPT family protein [Pseudooceanicola sp. HF7]|uniref:chloramphenicol phosphotransferase CPT family protein n=1 Tax=Pseudooceanicola sp. HF7 TaxID=2721560 RepID=UPI001431BCDF|nr:AAA family ATPase [Pseudooceanicola sp. HF7]NIZ10182.1 AAA family ATPase [Pseudooceanicola sp. HF7]